MSLKMIFAFFLLLPILVSGMENPCMDSLYLELKSMDINTLTEAEGKYFLQKDSICSSIFISNNKSNSEDTGKTYRSINSSIDTRPASVDTHPAPINKACHEPRYRRLKKANPAGMSDSDLDYFYGLEKMCKNEPDPNDPDSSTRSGTNPKHKRRSAGKVFSWIGIGIGVTAFVGSTVIRSNIEDECNPLFTVNWFKSEEECKEEADRQRSSAATAMVLSGIIAALGLFGLIAASSGTE